MNIQLKDRQRSYRKQLYSAKKKIAGLKKKVSSLTLVLTDLKQQNLVSESAMEHLGNTFNSIPKLLMNRYLKNIENESVSREKYPSVLRQFAATLQFYSCKAYEYVRNVFALALPNQSTIRKWYSNVNCEPGYVTAAFEALKIKVSHNKLKKIITYTIMI